MANAFLNVNETVICPYDNNHIILKPRFNTHLVKCRKNHPDAGYAICDYNHDHRIPKLELSYHHEICPNRVIQEATENYVDTDNLMNFPVRNLTAPVDDVWEEEELNHQGYDGEQYAAQNNIVRTRAVEQPAVKKQFRLDEQRRMNSIRTPVISNNVTSNSNEYSGIRTPAISNNVTSNHIEYSGPSTSASNRDVPIDEDRPELYLNERVNVTDTTIYQPADIEEGFQFPKSKSRRHRK